MKNIFLIVTLVVLINGCASIERNQKNEEIIIIDQPTYTCNIELPDDNEIDVYNFHPDDNNKKARKNCSLNRTSCPDEYFEYLDNFLNYKLSIEPKEKTYSGIMKSIKLQQDQICLKVYNRNYTSKIKNPSKQKHKKSKSWLDKLAF